MTATLLTLTAPEAEWMRRARCAGDWELMEGDTPEAERRAKALCHACPVKASCARWTLSLPPSKGVYGVAGGMTAGERDRVRRQIRRRRTPLVEAEEDAPKRCNNCGDVKPVTEFYQRPRDRRGREAQCIPCRRQQHKEYKAAQRAREAMA